MTVPLTACMAWPGERDDVQLCIAIQKLHALSPHVLWKLLQNCPGLTLTLLTGKGAELSVDILRTAQELPRHLLAHASQEQPDIWYIAKGLRLLPTLCALATCFPVLEQALLVDVSTRQQTVELVVLLLTVLKAAGTGGATTGKRELLHVFLVTAALELLPACVSPLWSDIALVLVVHPKALDCMEAATAAITNSASLLHHWLDVPGGCLSRGGEAARVVTEESHWHCSLALQCEISLQVFAALCESPFFGRHLLCQQRLCEGGGLADLVLAAMRLPRQDEARRPFLAACVSRIKSRALHVVILLLEASLSAFKLGSTLFLTRDAREELVHLIVREESLLQADMGRPAAVELASLPHGLFHVHALRVLVALSRLEDPSTLLAPYLLQVLSIPPREFASLWLGGASSDALASRDADAYAVYHPSSAYGPFPRASPSAESQSPADGVALSGPSGRLRDERARARRGAGGVLVARRAGRELHSATCAALLLKLVISLNGTDGTRNELWGDAAASRHELLKLLRSDRGNNGFCHRGGTTPDPAPDLHVLRTCTNMFALLHYAVRLQQLELVDDNDIVCASDFAEALHFQVCHHECPAGQAELDQAGTLCMYTMEAHERRLLAWQQDLLREPRWRRLLPPDADLLPSKAASHAAGKKKAKVQQPHIMGGGPPPTVGDAGAKIAGPAIEKALPAVPGGERQEGAPLPAEPGGERQEGAALPAEPGDGRQEGAAGVAAETETAGGGPDAGLPTGGNASAREASSGDAPDESRKGDPPGSGGDRQEPPPEVEGQPSAPGAAGQGSSRGPPESGRVRDKRCIFNEDQEAVVLQALAAEPNLARSASALEGVTSRLNSMAKGTTFQPSQIRNWIRNQQTRRRLSLLKSKPLPLGRAATSTPLRSKGVLSAPPAASRKGPDRGSPGPHKSAVQVKEEDIPHPVTVRGLSDPKKLDSAAARRVAAQASQDRAADGRLAVAGGGARGGGRATRAPVEEQSSSEKTVSLEVEAGAEETSDGAQRKEEEQQQPGRCMDIGGEGLEGAPIAEQPAGGAERELLPPAERLMSAQVTGALEKDLGWELPAGGRLQPPAAGRPQSGNRGPTELHCDPESVGASDLLKDREATQTLRKAFKRRRELDETLHKPERDSGRGLLPSDAPRMKATKRAGRLQSRKLDTPDRSIDS